MKKAVAHLVPYIEREQLESGEALKAAGKLVLATVKGDVHDIGKNIVGVVLGCNNYEIIDLGVMVPAAKILETAREVGADIIGLSGLITPSLDEMVHVAREMERQGFDVPLLIGSATTSRAHTAVKVEREYSGPTIHVTDASRSVGIVAQLMNLEERGALVDRVRAEYAKIRDSRSERESRTRFLTIEEARRRKVEIDWTRYTTTKPRVEGIKVLSGYSLKELRDYIDWSPFFKTWELRGNYPAIFEDPVVGTEAQKLFDDAQHLLNEIESEKLLTANAVVGLFPANAVNDDDIVVYSDREGTAVRAVIHNLRQQQEKPPGRPNFCLTDYVAPKNSGVIDYVGAFAVTAGIGIEGLCERFQRVHDDYRSIMAKALADRLAEAFAERLHQLVRTDIWGFSPGEELGSEDLIRERYVGIRPAPGYPACPDHSEKQTLFDLLDVTANTGIELTESYAMKPGASVCGWYLSHPKSTYFGIGKINLDQARDYAIRKGMELAEVERWISPNLGYEAGATVPA